MLHPPTSEPAPAPDGGARGWAIAAVVLLAAAGLAVALWWGDDDTADEGPPPTAPLTGLPVDGEVRPALMVKVDGVEAARPQEGLAAADVIVNTQVEGGLTRLTAIYSSTDPGQVGPVRSVRLGDLDVADLLGRPALAFSGGAGPVLERVDAAAADGSVVLVTPDVAPDAFERRPDRQGPHDLFADADALWAAAEPEAQAPRPLFAYGPAAAGEPTTGATLRFPATLVEYRWDAGSTTWVRSQDGTEQVDAADDATLAVANVVVLEVAYTPSPTDDRSVVPVLAGGGEAWVLRDGEVARCSWDAADGSSPAISLVADDGTTCALTPGRTFLELAPEPPAVAPGEPAP